MSSPRNDSPMDSTAATGHSSTMILSKINKLDEKMRQDEVVHTTALESGDIIIQLSEARKNLVGVENHAAHGAIINGISSVVHSAVGRFKSQVTSHRLDKVIERDDALGSAMVLRCQNKMIQEYLAKMINEKTFSDTPFSYTHTRRLDDVKDENGRQKLDFFRAFRAFQRISDNLSVKRKG